MDDCWIVIAEYLPAEDLCSFAKTSRFGRALSLKDLYWYNLALEWSNGCSNILEERNGMRVKDCRAFYIKHRLHQRPLWLKVDATRVFWRILTSQFLKGLKQELTVTYDCDEDEPPFSVTYRMEYNGEEGGGTTAFWAKKNKPRSESYGGYQVILHSGAYIHTDPPSIHTNIYKDIYMNSYKDETMNQYKYKDDIVCRVWKDTGTEWGWPSFVNSLDDLLLRQHGKFIILSIKWLHQSAKVRAVLGQGMCTFPTTQTTHAVQPWYHCKTCKLYRSEIRHLGCCENCAKVCHAGHEVEFIRMATCFCDCGANTLGYFHQMESQHSMNDIPSMGHTGSDEYTGTRSTGTTQYTGVCLLNPSAPSTCASSEFSRSPFIGPTSSLDATSPPPYTIL